MNYEQIINLIAPLLAKRFNNEFFIDTARLEVCLVEDYKQLTSNITLPVPVIENIILRPISLVTYSQLNNRSYESIIANKELYTSLVETKVNQRSRYTIAEFEAPHFMRYNHFGKLLEKKIRSCPALNKAIIEEAIRNGETTADIILQQLKSLYNL